MLANEEHARAPATQLDVNLTDFLRKSDLRCLTYLRHTLLRVTKPEIDYFQIDGHPNRPNASIPAIERVISPVIAGFAILLPSCIRQ